MDKHHLTKESKFNCVVNEVRNNFLEILNKNLHLYSPNKNNKV